MPRHPNAYVRAAKASETAEIEDLLTLAFINDPTMCYYGGAPALVKDPANPTPSEQRTVRELRVFMSAMLKIPKLVHGNVDVVVVPAERDGSSAKPGSSKEHIAAAALWLPPGASVDFNLRTSIRAGIISVAFAWGLAGIRNGRDYGLAVEKTLEREFKARNLPRSDSWHLYMIAVHPDHQGEGYSSMLFKEGFRRAAPKVCHLTASKPKNKNIYEHFGFELVETHVVGIGDVDSSGIKAKGAAAVGVPEFVMIKWTVDKPQ